VVQADGPGVQEHAQPNGQRWLGQGGRRAFILH